MFELQLIINELVKFNLFDRKMKIGIIGGGPAGLSTAIGLKRLGFEVVILESGSYEKTRTGEHLAAEALHEFRKMGIPESILVNNSIPCTEVRSAWGQSELSANESIFNPFGSGYILSRPNFDEALFNYCLEIGIEAMKGVRVSKATRIGDHWELRLNDTSIEVDFLIDASGRNSKFRLEKGVEKLVTDQLIGVTKHIVPNLNTKPKDSFVLVESTPKGWWYSVQLSSGAIMATFMTDAKTLSNSDLTKEMFWETQLELSHHTKIRLKELGNEGSFSVHSARSQILNLLTGSKWMAVGDAAQSYDPLSSAGIIKGLKMGQLAATKLSEHYNSSPLALDEYEAQIRTQYEEYLVLKEDYYLKEKRWISEAFWFKRNLKPNSIQHFTIHPNTKLELLDSSNQVKLDFLKEQFPDIDLKELIESINLHSVAKDSIAHYMKIFGLTTMNKNILYALENLKLTGMIRRSRI